VSFIKQIRNRIHSETATAEIV